LHASATPVLKLFAIAPVDNLTRLLWRCLDFSKKHTHHQRTVRGLFRKQETQHSKIWHSRCSVLFILLENRTKVNADTCVSMRLERWTNVFVTSYVRCNPCTYDL